jgi:hypothetical protein
MVAATEARLGCRPRRRTELVQQRISALAATIAQKQRWIEQQEAIIREQIERQIRLGDRLHSLRAELASLEAQYADRQVAPHSKLAQARQQKETWERQLGAALEQEGQARRALCHHQRHLAALSVERDALLNHLARLEVDNAANPNPVRMRWLLDGGFGDAANVTYLVELGYDLYTIAHNGKSTQVLLKEVPAAAQWVQAGSRTQALDMKRSELGDCPYPVRLTLLRWSLAEEFKYSTLISFSDAEALPTEDLFPAYHERQDVEAGIKQGKGTFSFSKLRVRSSAGIRLLGQFALVFWPNFVRWAADWLADQVRDEQGRFKPVLEQVRTQVRIAANTPAVLLTNASGQLLEFDADGPYAGVQICFDRPFAYQFPMPLFQTWQQRWSVSFEPVKVRLTTIATDEFLSLFVGVPVALPGAGPP